MVCISRIYPLIGKKNEEKKSLFTHWFTQFIMPPTCAGSEWVAFMVGLFCFGVPYVFFFCIFI